MPTKPDNAKVVNLFDHPDFTPAPKETEKKGRKPKGYRKDKRVQRTFQDGFRPDGKPNVKSFYGSTIAEAEAARDAYKNKLKLGIDVSKEGMTVADWLDEWVAVYKKHLGAKATNTLASHVKRVKERIGDKKVTDVRNIHLQAILNEMEGMSVSAVSSVHQVLTGSFKKAVTNKILLSSPAEDLTMPETTEGSHRTLEPWEISLIFLHWQIHRFGRVVIAMMLTGMRPGEAAAITWDAIDMEKRTVTIKDAAEMVTNQPRNRGKTKTDAGMRVIPMCDDLFHVLDATPPEDREGYVFLSAHGKQLSRCAIERGLEAYLYVLGRLINGDDITKQQTGRPHRRDLSKAKDEAQLEKWKKKNAEVDAWEAARKKAQFQPYDLRHTFITGMYDAGVGVVEASYFAGHKSIETTLRIYTHLTEMRKKQGAASMVNFLNSWKAAITQPEEKGQESETSGTEL